LHLQSLFLQSDYTMPDFDPIADITALKARTKTLRKKRYSRSSLDKFKGELITKFNSGATGAQLHYWLSTKRVKVNPSTVNRWLIKNGCIR